MGPCKLLFQTLFQIVVVLNSSFLVLKGVFFYIIDIIWKNDKFWVLFSMRIQYSPVKFETEDSNFNVVNSMRSYTFISTHNHLSFGNNSTQEKQCIIWRVLLILNKKYLKIRNHIITFKNLPRKNSEKVSLEFDGGKEDDNEHKHRGFFVWIVSPTFMDSLDSNYKSAHI